MFQRFLILTIIGAAVSACGAEGDSSPQTSGTQSANSSGSTLSLTADCGGREVKSMALSQFKKCQQAYRDVESQIFNRGDMASEAKAEGSLSLTDEATDPMTIDDQSLAIRVLSPEQKHSGFCKAARTKPHLFKSEDPSTIFDPTTCPWSLKGAKLDDVSSRFAASRTGQREDTALSRERRPWPGQGSSNTEGPQAPGTSSGRSFD
jgi:hypothetical protein